MKEKQAAVQTAEDIAKSIAEDIGTKAYYALLEEVYTTPKPGLVDLYSCGAHTDMNVQTFEKSAEALRPWFIRMAAQGYLLTCTREDLFVEIRKTGILAEKAMFHATGNVNTHKGMIFTLGIFCAAAGRCMKDYGEIKLKTLIRTEQDMVSRILKKELEELQKTDEKTTNGVRNLRAYGTTGIRGEALAGYPSVTEIALPDTDVFSLLQSSVRLAFSWMHNSSPTRRVSISQWIVCVSSERLKKAIKCSPVTALCAHQMAFSSSRHI